MGSGEQSLPEFGQTLLRPAFRAMARKCVAGAIAFVFMDWRGAPHMLDAAQGVFEELKNMIVWVKDPGMGSFFRSAMNCATPSRSARASTSTTSASAAGPAATYGNFPAPNRSAQNG